MTKKWVKFSDGNITEGPVTHDECPAGYVEYEEILDIHPDAGECHVTVEMVGGKCVKRVVGKPSYKAQRRRAYPSTADQLDMLWHAMDKGQLPKAEPFYSQIRGVKQRFPKEVPS